VNLNTTVRIGNMNKCC